MRVHLLALPNVQTTWEYDLDGFNVMTIRFAMLLKALGHYVLLYASEENQAPCDELIVTTTKAEQIQHYGTASEKRYQLARQEPDQPMWALFNQRATQMLAKKKQPHDIVCFIGGGAQKPILDAHPELIGVEYSIGYIGNYSPYRVYQSRAWQHHSYGRQHNDNVRFFDTVIPGFFEADKFPVRQPEDYVCYVGRVMPKKGISIVCDAARAAGVNVKFVGHGDEKLVKYGEFLGPLPELERNEVMARAKALIAPSCYIEPYGCISPEAQLCGTPVISTDAGGFTETVEHGFTGFRCTMLGEFVDAIQRVETLDRQFIRQRAQALYSMEAAAPQYQRYFKKLQTLWEPAGFYTMPFPLETA